jgi:hypothetical protein
MDFWLKSIGATRSPLEDEWLSHKNVGVGGLTASPRLAERVHFPRGRRPTGIEIGDRFLLHGITELGGRIIGAGIFTSRFREEDRREELELRGSQDVSEWPWRIDIEMLISLWHSHKGPRIEAIGLEPRNMSQRSHRRLTEDQYKAGVLALAEVAMPSSSGSES